MAKLRLVAYTPNGPRLGPLATPGGVACMWTHNGMAALSFDYPLDGAGAKWLGAPVEIAVETVTAPGGVGGGEWGEAFNSRFLYLGDTRDAAARQSWQVTCLPQAVRFSKAVVAYTNLDGNGQRTFTAGTSLGYVIHTLWQEASVRGALVGCGTPDPTTTQDNGGTPWVTLAADWSVDPGTDLLTAFTDLTERYLYDWATSARTICFYRRTPDSKDPTLWTSALATDRTADGIMPSLIAGRHFTEANVQRSWEGMLSHAIVGGDYATTTTRSSGTTPWGRWETFVSASGYDAAADLNAAGDAALVGAGVVTSRTVTLTVPTADDNVITPALMGDLVKVVLGPVDKGAIQGPERVRVASITLSTDAGTGQPGGNLVLGDVILPPESIIYQRAITDQRGPLTVLATGKAPAQAGTTDDHGTINYVTADGSSNVTISHKLGHPANYGQASIGNAGYVAGFLSSTATTATFWVRSAGNALVPGGQFVFTYLVK